MSPTHRTNEAHEGPKRDGHLNEHLPKGWCKVCPAPTISQTHTRTAKSETATETPSTRFYRSPRASLWPRVTLARLAALVSLHLTPAWCSNTSSAPCVHDTRAHTLFPFVTPSSRPLPASGASVNHLFALPHLSALGPSSPRDLFKDLSALHALPHMLPLPAPPLTCLLLDYGQAIQHKQPTTQYHTTQHCEPSCLQPTSSVIQFISQSILAHLQVSSPASGRVRTPSRMEPPGTPHTPAGIREQFPKEPSNPSLQPPNPWAGDAARALREGVSQPIQQSPLPTAMEEEAATQAAADRAAMPPPPPPAPPAASAEPFEATMMEEARTASDRDKAKEKEEQLTALENLGYLRIRQIKQREEIAAHTVLGAYHDLAIMMDEEMPEIPEEGVGCGLGKFGPWDLYMPYELAKAFAQKHSEIEDEAGNKLAISALKVMPEEMATAPVALATGPTYKPYLEEKAGWIECSLKAGEQFSTIHKNDIIKSLQGAGLRVYRGSRSQVKMEVEGEMIQMGVGTRTDKLNFTVLPREGAFEDFAWPGLENGELKGLSISSELTGKMHKVSFRLGGAGAKDMHGEYTQCKRKVSACDCKSFCEMNARERSAELYSSPFQPSSRKRGDPSGAESQRTAAEKRQARASSAQSAFLAARLKPGEIDCKHLLVGRCRSGTKCKFRHAPTDAPRDGSRVEDWEQFPCSLDKRPLSGKCLAHPNCIYSPCAEEQRAEKAAAVMPARLSLLATPSFSHG